MKPFVGHKLAAAAAANYPCVMIMKGIILFMTCLVMCIVFGANMQCCVQVEALGHCRVQTA